MPTKLVRNFDVDGTELPSSTVYISDEQLAEEAEQEAMLKVGALIDGIANLADAKTFLKRLCRRLRAKGLL